MRTRLSARSGRRRLAAEPCRHLGPRGDATETWKRRRLIELGYTITPAEIVNLARDAGFDKVTHVGATDLAQRYFSGRNDGLNPSSAEQLIVATRQ